MQALFPDKLVQFLEGRDTTMFLLSCGMVMREDASRQGVEDMFAR